MEKALPKGQENPEKENKPLADGYREKGGRLKDKADRRGWRRALAFVLPRLFAAGLVFLFFSLLWAKENYGNVSMEELIFHINMPTEGVAQDAVEDFLNHVLVPFGIAMAFYLLALIFPRTGRLYFQAGRRGWRIWLLPLRMPFWYLIFVLISGYFFFFLKLDAEFSVVEYLRMQMERSSFIEEEYVPPGSVQLTFPREKKNLICIYVESAESSSQDRKNGGLFDVNYIPELTRIARDNISFSHSSLLEGAAVTPDCSWTIAGLVAQTAGLPLKLPPEYNNRMSKYEEFLPGVVSLGEILEEEGYHNYFMAGSDFSFGGRRKYFSQHGNYEILDYLWAKRNGKIDKDYKVFWGFEDEKLFTFAKEELLQIAAKPEPFNFSLLTVDTHAPNGYVCQLCGDEYRAQYANVWACASAQIGAFVDWLKQQDFYQDTVVYICGDHLSMNRTFYGLDTEDDYPGEAKRKVYNAILNAAAAPAREENRRFTTLDMFPTVLGALGVQIENDRLGLGTNLFSDEETLSEKYGYETLFAEIKKKSEFYNEELLFPKE